MDDIYEISLLIDFYGQLLTVRQNEILSLYYYDDLSLGEIAEDLKISRQGVYDNLKRGKKILLQMENKLELIKKYNVQKTKIIEVLNILDTVVMDNLSVNDKGKIYKVKDNVKSILDNFL